MKTEETKGQLERLLEPLRGMNAFEQLRFWRTFRVIHRRRIGNCEAQLCPELLKAVDEQIASLKALVAQGA